MAGGKLGHVPPCLAGRTARLPRPWLELAISNVMGPLQRTLYPLLVYRGPVTMITSAIFLHRNLEVVGDRSFGWEIQSGIGLTPSPKRHRSLQSATMRTCAPHMPASSRQLNVRLTEQDGRLRRGFVHVQLCCLSTTSMLQPFQASVQQAPLLYEQCAWARQQPSSQLTQVAMFMCTPTSSRL